MAENPVNPYRKTVTDSSNTSEFAPNLTATFHQKSWWISFSVHLFLIVGAFLFFDFQSSGSAIDVDGPRRVSIVLATITDNQNTQYLESDDLIKNEPVTNSAGAAATFEAVPESSPSNLAEFLPKDPAGFSPKISDFDADRASKVPAVQNAASREIKLTSEDLAAIEAEQRAIAATLPVGEPAKATVFGSDQMAGHKWVFVIDRSKSMGSGGLGVLEKASTQLGNAVANMGTNHKFQVVAYNHETVTIDERRLLVANEANKQKVRTFVYNLAATGGTEHFSALVIALTYQPDVVVLMTDGSFPEMKNHEIKQIEAMAGNTTMITCLQFGDVDSPAEGKFMQVLADQTGGTYKYIDVRKWK
jgi:hypothetical protein